MATVAMPQMGETVTEGTVVTWLKAVGDTIAREEPLCEISTEKVDTEVPSPFAGVVTSLLVDEGATVPIGTPIAIITAPGESAPALAPTPPPAERASVAPSQPPAPASPAGREVVGPRSASRATGLPAYLSPAVRRLLDEHGLDASTIVGTGEGGRLTRADVEARIGETAAVALDQPVAVTPPLATPAPSAPEPPSGADGPTTEHGDEVLPFSPIRRAIAERMPRSLATSAHTLVVMEVDYSAVTRVRDARKDEFRARHGVPLTYLAFVARATIEALRAFGRLNAKVVDQSLVVRRRINLGIAVDLDFEGLVVPVVPDADTLTLTGLALAIAERGERARTRSLSPADVTNGSFTITNAGGYGTFMTGPIINQPQVAILSTDGIKVKPVAVPQAGGGYALGFHPVGNLALSFDHRANDGAYASAFLARVRDELEGRDWEAEA